MKEIKRDDSVMWSGVVFEDSGGKLHIFNPAISLEEANELLNYQR